MLLGKAVNIFSFSTSKSSVLKTQMYKSHMEIF